MQGGELPDGAVPQAQLQTRHWRGFRRNSAGEREQTFVVDGDAVVGKFPIVKPGVRHNYTSATSGVYGDELEGWFMFVPGTLAQPLGPAFRVECPKICWTDTGFIF